MKKIIIALFFLLTGFANAQDNLFGIEINGLKSNDSWTQKADEPTVFIKYNIDNFEEVFLVEDKGMVFNCYNPTGLVLYEVYKALVSQFGTETINEDYLPSELKGTEYETPDNIAAYVSLNKAKIFRVWNLKDKDYSVIFEFSKKTFHVSILKK